MWILCNGLVREQEVARLTDRENAEVQSFTAQKSLAEKSRLGWRQWTHDMVPWFLGSCVGR